MRDYMEGKARQLGIDPEDALQDALVDVWVEAREKGWPEDPVESRRFLFRQLRDAAIDAVRQRRGRSGNRPDILPVDFQAAETHGGSDNDRLAASLGAHLAREALGREGDPGFLKRGVLVGAFAALSERQKQIVFRRGVNEDTPKELAHDLGVSENVVRQDHFHGLRTLRDLIAHARADPDGLPSEERERLYAYLDGSMPRGERSAFKKHLDFCSTCQDLAELEREVRWSGAHVLLPVPLVLAGWTPAAALAASSGAGAAPASAAATAKGGAVSIKLAASASLGAKIAVGATMATMLVGTAVAGVGASQWRQDRPTTTQTVAKAPASAALRAGAAVAARPTPLVARPKARPQPRTAARPQPRPTERPKRTRPARRKQLPGIRTAPARAPRASAPTRSAPTPTSQAPAPSPVPSPVVASPATAPAAPRALPLRPTPVTPANSYRESHEFGVER